MTPNRLITYVLLLCIALIPWSATALNPRGSHSSHHTLVTTAEVASLLSAAAEKKSEKPEEALLIQSLVSISQGKHQEALATINQLVQLRPHFKLAHLIRGDLLMAQGQALQEFGNNQLATSEQVKDYQAEASRRIARYLTENNQDKLPNLLLSPSTTQAHLVVVDTEHSRLYLYKNTQGVLSYVDDFYVTVGKNGVGKKTEGDKRTPLGVYFAQKKMTQPLADMYGDGAYPLNFPNEWDKLRGVSGSGIWLHGTPHDTYSRAPQASDGCVVVANEDLKSLAPILQTGNTPVIITDHIDWVESGQVNPDAQPMTQAFNQWLDDWRKQNTEQYLQHYSANFNTNGITFKQWADHKRRVQANTARVSIEVANISLFSYPAISQKVVVVDFVQTYQSDLLKNVMRKRQYWQLENEEWKIIYENAA